MGRPGAFGVEHERVASFGVFLWEDFRGVSLVLLTIGLSSLATVNRRLLLGILLWLVPYAATAILFKVEGQHDCWLVAAWLPFHLMVGLGLYLATFRLPQRGRAVATGAAALLSLFVAYRANHDDLDQRHYDLATIFGHVHLQNLDPDAIVVLNNDDSLSICGYLQRVKGERPDVVIVTQSFLGLSFVGEGDWYDARLQKSYPFLKPPDYAGARNRLPGVRPIAAHLAAFLDANVGGGRPMFTQTPLPASLLPAGVVQVPAGVLWKLVARGQEAVDLRYWNYPMQPEDVQGLMRRERGLRLIRDVDGLHAQAEAYEFRLLAVLLKGRISYAEVCLDLGRPEEALRLLESVRLMDPDYDERTPYLFALGKAYHAMGDGPHAEAVLQRALSLGLTPPANAWAFCFLGEICVQKGKKEEAVLCFAQALKLAGPDDPALRARLEKVTAPKPAADVKK